MQLFSLKQGNFFIKQKIKIHFQFELKTRPHETQFQVSLQKSSTVFVYNFWWNFKKIVANETWIRKILTFELKKISAYLLHNFCVFSSKKMKTRVNSWRYWSCDSVSLICEDCHNHNSQKIAMFFLLDFRKVQQHILQMHSRSIVHYNLFR